MAMANGIEYFHVAQPTRREKLRSVALVNNLHGYGDLIFDSSLFSSDFGQDFDRRKVTQACKSSSGSVMGLVEGIRTNNSSSLPHLHYPPQLPRNPTPFDQSYDGDGDVLVFNPERLSLSLSSQRHQQKDLDLQKYGSDNYCSGINGSSSNDQSRSLVALVPCTGYSLILKGSRFLKPAQLLLEEFYDVLGQTGRITEKLMADSSLMNPPHDNFKGSTCSEKRSTLIILLDEVYTRYKQYYGQMQEVMTSFEYVAGLGNAAPYVGLAIKAMSKHFRELKHTITDQLQSTHNASRPIINSGFFDNQTVWRPQRGLPDRAVSVLRSWLFNHFLHPYPTDSDKHMLAKQTGLSRNQVSNWFINARVRIWKPMVEEIYTLESRRPPKVSNTAAQKLATNLRTASPSTAGAGCHDLNISGPGSISLTLGLHQNNSRIGTSKLNFPINGFQSVSHGLEANTNGEDGWY